MCAKSSMTEREVGYASITKLCHSNAIDGSGFPSQVASREVLLVSAKSNTHSMLLFVGPWHRRRHEALRVADAATMQPD